MYLAGRRGRKTFAPQVCVYIPCEAQRVDGNIHLTMCSRRSSPGLPMYLFASVWSVAKYMIRFKWPTIVGQHLSHTWANYEQPVFVVKVEGDAARLFPGTFKIPKPAAPPEDPRLACLGEEGSKKKPKQRRYGGLKVFVGNATVPKKTALGPGKSPVTPVPKHISSGSSDGETSDMLDPLDEPPPDLAPDMLDPPRPPTGPDAREAKAREKRGDPWPGPNGYFRIARMEHGWGCTCGRHWNTDQYTNTDCQKTIRPKGTSPSDRVLTDAECVVQLKRLAF